MGCDHCPKMLELQIQTALTLSYCELVPAKDRCSDPAGPVAAVPPRKPRNQRFLIYRIRAPCSHTNQELWNGRTSTWTLECTALELCNGMHLSSSICSIFFGCPQLWPQPPTDCVPGAFPLRNTILTWDAWGHRCKSWGPSSSPHSWFPVLAVHAPMTIITLGSRWQCVPDFSEHNLRILPISSSLIPHPIDRVPK